MEINLLVEEQSFLKLLEKKGKSFNTLKNYRADLQCFNHFLVGKNQSLKLKGFSLDQVNEYATFLDQKYNSPNSVRRRVQALRLFFDFLISQNLYPDNPLKKMPVSPKVLDIPHPTPFVEVLLIHELLKKRILGSEKLSQLVNMRNLIIFHLIYGGGLKVSDLHKLHLKSILKSGKNFRVMVEHPKRDPYSVPLPVSFNSSFQSYKNLYLEFLQDQDLQIEELLFNANPFRILAGGLSPRGIELFFEDLRNETKTSITAKSLRQSCIFKWLGQNLNHATLREWLGVTPSYSLDLYLEELKKGPDQFVFSELEDQDTWPSKISEKNSGTHKK